MSHCHTQSSRNKFLKYREYYFGIRGIYFARSSMKITLYHNPQCSKSRETLKLLQEKDVEVIIIEYLKKPLTLSELESISQKLNMQPRQFMRTQEDAYKTENLADATLSNKDLFQAIINHPRLLERPIAISQNSAAVGRPPENVLALL